MSFVSYYMRIMSGMSLKRFSEVLDRAHQFSGWNKARLTLDMIASAVRYGAGYYDYLTFGFWGLTAKQRATYITRVKSKKLVTFLNDASYEHIFNDKEEFHSVFPEFTRREALNFRTASKEEVAAFVQRHPVLFAKPAHGSCGKDCQRFALADYEDFDALYAALEANNAWLLEELLVQHPQNAEVYPNAINCMRMITLLDDAGEPHVIFVTQKYGLNGRVVDNYGFGCRVDLETGRICSPGVSGDGSLGIVYEEHPMTHVKLVGREIPCFFEACEMVKKAALRIPQMRYIGWDVGITPDGPAIVEGNNYCAHDFWQLPAQTPEKTGMLPVFQKLVPSFKG